MIVQPCNCSDTVADALNRPTSIGGVAITSDILGNRLTKGSSVSYGWDVLNRMTSYTAGSITTSYVYRADGMRVSKSDSTGSAVYRYDGQMCMQDVETTSTSTIVNDYALGARGIDAVSRTDSSGTAVGYPVYDGHGNRVATLTKSGSSFALGDLRSYDAWGNVLTGGSTGRPRGRYVANLGHVQDDESSLIYMRARYYEPGSGRFVSQDPARDGFNWFVYCRNNPGNGVDPDGKEAWDLSKWYGIVGAGAYAFAFLMSFTAVVLACAGEKAMAVGALAVASAASALALLGSEVSNDLKAAGAILRFTLTNQVITSILGVVASGLEESKRLNLVSKVVVAGWTAHTMAIIGALTWILMDG